MSKNGGPAFPRAGSGARNGHHDGMSLLDYFAAQAMQAVWMKWDSNKTIGEAIDETPVIAYELAASMLKARQQ